MLRTTCEAHFCTLCVFSCIRMTAWIFLSGVVASTGSNRDMGGRGGTHLLLDSVVWPLTTHPFRDGAPFLLLIETPPTFRRSLRFFRVLHRNCLLILSPFCFTVCGHHLSPRIAIVFSLLSSLPNSNSSMSHTSNSSSPPLTHPVVYFTFSYYVSPTLYGCATQAHTCSHVLPLPTSGISLSSF